MKLFSRFMFAALFIAVLLPFTILKDEDGDTLMSVSDIKLPGMSAPSLPKMPSLPKASKSVGSGAGWQGRDIIYKWYDNDGNVQYTTEPPVEGVDYTVKEFNPNANVVKSVKIRERAVEPEPEQPNATPADDTAGGDSAYSTDGIKKLIKDTENIENLLNQRLKNQNSALNQ